MQVPYGELCRALGAPKSKYLQRSGKYEVRRVVHRPRRDRLVRRVPDGDGFARIIRHRIGTFRRRNIGLRRFKGRHIERVILIHAPD